MANIKLKPISNLKEWNKKELRKLKITLQNRISAFSSSSSPKELSQNHPLYQMEGGECKELLLKVIQAEKATDRQ